MKCLPAIKSSALRSLFRFECMFYAFRWYFECCHRRRRNYLSMAWCAWPHTAHSKSEHQQSVHNYLAKRVSQLLFAIGQTRSSFPPARLASTLRSKSVHQRTHEVCQMAIWMQNTQIQELYYSFVRICYFLKKKREFFSFVDSDSYHKCLSLKVRTAAMNSTMAWIQHRSTFAMRSVVLSTLCHFFHSNALQCLN